VFIAIGVQNGYDVEIGIIDNIGGRCSVVDELISDEEYGRRRDPLSGVDAAVDENGAPHPAGGNRSGANFQNADAAVFETFPDRFYRHVQALFLANRC